MNPNDPHAAEAVVDSKRRFSIVWLVPLAAALIGGWLVYKAMTEKGPTISIRFVAAEGIVAGKTKIKYKDIEAGTVETVALSDDLSSVLVTATLAKQLQPHLTENTRFWVVRARLAGGHVSGLETLLSGVYIGMEPSDSGKPATRFVGLEDPPPITVDTPGKEFTLQADALGSLDVGSPVYFRQIKAGQVIRYALNDDGIEVHVFVDSPYDKLVGEHTRFWNASGITATLNADGIKVRTESVAALLVGGVSFENRGTTGSGEDVADDHIFNLYPDHQATRERVYAHTERLLLYFTGSVRGLQVGAPVELLGLKLGEVVDIKLQGNTNTMEFRVPVLIEIEPDRIEVEGVRIRDPGGEAELQALRALVNNGLRAQLKTGSLLTGQLYVDLAFFPDAPAATVGEEDGTPVLPTVPGTLAELRGSLLSILAKLEALPFEEIGNNLNTTLAGASQLTNSPELQQAIVSLDATLKQTDTLARNLNGEVVPAIDTALQEIIRTLKMAQGNIVSSKSPVYVELTRALKDLSSAARSIKTMADYLERHPDALLRGKSRGR